MRATDFIADKKNNIEHSREDMQEFIMSYVENKLPDYQVSAWLMAVTLNSMTEKETANLTDIMAASGDVNDLSSFKYSVDKHSTGGVGDKTSLVLAPLLATMGATVAKMSGRGLGHTGGTVDKLESIPNFRVALSDSEFMKQAKDIGLVITGQSKDLAPADGKLYALRDATATVQSLPLIASSIMSKKLAGGAKSIVLDVKVGSGAFMKTIDQARALAQAMISIGKHNDRNVNAVLTNMEEPLGFAIGNALEVNEAMATLKGNGPEDLTELCVTLAAQVLKAAGLESDKAKILETLESGRAYKKFEEWISAQGGELASLGNLELAKNKFELVADKSGYLSKLDALSFGNAVKVLGGGRATKEDEIDLGVGVVLHKKIGDAVTAGDSLLTIYHNNRGFKDALGLIQNAIEISDNLVDAPRLIFEVL